MASPAICTVVRNFCKFYGATADPYPARSRRFFIPLTHKLHHQGILPHVPYPLETKDGALWVDLPGYMLVLQPFIAGEDVGFDGLPPDVLRQLATQVGKLHRATEQLTCEHPFYERYEILFAPALDAIMQQIDEWALSENENHRKLAAMLRKYDDIVQYALDFVRHAPSTPAFAKAKVICHTDLHGGNMMLDANRQLYALDWENALIAPPEHDLFFWAGEPYFWETFWPLYVKAFGDIPHLEPEVFRYYYYRRALEDMVGFVELITSRDGGTQRDVKELEHLFIDLPSADVTVQRIAEKLQSMETTTCD